MKIEHVAIWTLDLERLKNFYCRHFGARGGAKYINPRTGFASYFLSFDSGARLELMQRPGLQASRGDIDRPSTGLVHVALSVGSQEHVDSLTAQLALEGNRVLDGPRRTGDGYYESVVLDPDGNRIEITV